MVLSVDTSNCSSVFLLVFGCEVTASSVLLIILTRLVLVGFLLSRQAVKLSDWPIFSIFFYFVS